MMKNKALPILFLLSLSISFAIAADQQRGHGRGPQLTDAQKTCLDGKLGAPGSGERPSHEAMEAAFSACGVEKPKGGRPPGDKPADAQNQNQDSNQSADE